ncbi:MAG: hypothetical protein JRI23_10550, partial [Deltaproteobacteria bacterium]|nr:hypothetical protein [Deltaproteobacteria bacterium]MBW2532114.1 hypothetical protein [Deltaproteobacteria bacterium]
MKDDHDDDDEDRTDEDLEEGEADDDAGEEDRSDDDEDSEDDDEDSEDDDEDSEDDDEDSEDDDEDSEDDDEDSEDDDGDSEDDDEDERDASAGSSDRGAARPAAPNKLVYAAIALIVGGAAGWFARDAGVGRGLGGDGSTSGDGSALPAGSAGAAEACDRWKQAVCEGAGPKSTGCKEATSAAELLPAKACAQALSQVPITVANIKRARADCDTLVTKLCTDLGTDSPMCAMVSQQTATFPAERCKVMLTNYAQVLAGLKQAGQPGGMRPPPGPPRGAPVGPGMPPGHPPMDAPPSPAPP